MNKGKEKDMRKYIIYTLISISTFGIIACNNDDEIDRGHSIFTTEPVEYNEFDQWLLKNYTYPYNIDFKYRMQDIESDQKYKLVPADYDKAIMLSKIIKHVWMEAYTELAGPNFVRSYVPKTFHLIGSPAYDSSGTMVLLNKYYFETMHHEFAHILHQKRNYDPSFERICEGKYIGTDWYQESDRDGGNTNAWKQGFVTAYAMSEAREDFVENIAMYVTHDETYWSTMLAKAGETGAAIINEKFAIVYNYMFETWGIDLNDLRAIVLRRQQEIPELELNTIE